MLILLIPPKIMFTLHNTNTIQRHDYHFDYYNYAQCRLHLQ